ncbi:hypothetical protein [Pseudoroseicyclus aestuarii]|uniref:Uncharacterized protein n=1 Tax=Pseudoroseicyclus aestuarii TaxID=1795041 RepID=A0A318SXL3_9RHOB|nr:hypothetical protein [Pseudoroseicyclus aestuarii]PYE86095.1 hypothetical protein DFP88_101771 [Pseudoroseicyclus aestuarii]
MKWKHVAEHWTAFVPNILEEWPQLDEDEVQATEGDLSSFLDHFVDATGMTREDARDELSEWLQGTDPADAVMDESRDNERIIASSRDIHPGEDPFDDDGEFGDDDKDENPVGRTDDD